MAYKLTQSAQFEESLFTIIEYLVRHFGTDSAPKRLMRSIDRIMSILKSTPYIKALSQKPMLAAEGLREYYFMSYVILYKVKDNTVTLVNLFHQSQNYESPRHWSTQVDDEITHSTPIED